MSYEVLSQLYQPMSILFLYLNSERHNSVIELCREQKQIKNICSQQNSMTELCRTLFKHENKRDMG